MKSLWSGGKERIALNEGLGGFFSKEEREGTGACCLPAAAAAAADAADADAADAADAFAAAAAAGRAQTPPVNSQFASRQLLFPCFCFDKKLILVGRKYSPM